MKDSISFEESLKKLEEIAEKPKRIRKKKDE